MPEQLQPVIDVVIASFQVDTDLLIQGAIIALLVGFMMSRFGQLIYYVAIASYLTCWSSRSGWKSMLMK